MIIGFSLQIVVQTYQDFTQVLSITFLCFLCVAKMFGSRCGNGTMDYPEYECNGINNDNFKSLGPGGTCAYAYDLDSRKCACKEGWIPDHYTTCIKQSKCYCYLCKVSFPS